jgi:hypothetical protein
LTRGNGISKKLNNYMATIALQLRATEQASPTREPQAMAAGVADHVWTPQ